MLVLMRRGGEVIDIGDNIHVTVIEVRGGKVRLGVDAPYDVPVDRREVRERRGLVADDGAAPEIDCPPPMAIRSS